MPSFVYILKSQGTGRYYVGCSGDPERRLTEHNTGKVTSTKAYTPWLKVYLEEHPDHAAARRRERQIKSMKSRRYIESLIDGESRTGSREP